MFANAACTTYGEKSAGSSRRLATCSIPSFTRRIRLGHEGNSKVTELGFKCFEYALEEYARATRLNGGKPAKPDWADIFSSAPSIADVFNQAIYSKFDYMCVPLEFRMLLPEPLCRNWIAE